MSAKYGLIEKITTASALLITKMFYRKARLIRRPFYIRGKSSMIYGAGLTTGHSCRFDLPGKGKTLQIGANCKMGDNVHIVAYRDVQIGDNCLFASNIFISDTSHGGYNKMDNQSEPYTFPDDREFVTTFCHIGNNVWIGENVCLLPNVNVGDGSIIGAGTIVTKDIPTNSIVAGNPGKVIKRWSDETKCWEKV